MTAVTDRATLITRLAGDCNRVGDTDFLAACPGFIQSAEAEMNRRLRVRKMIYLRSGTLDTEYDTVPTDFAGVRSFELLATTPYALEYVSPEALVSLKWGHTTSGKPLYYTIVGEQFLICPVPGEGYQSVLTYWQRIPALGVTQTDNWLLRDHPDAYVFGALVHAFDWLQDTERSMAALQKFGIVLSDIETDDRSQSYGASMQTRTTTVV